MALPTSWAADIPAEDVRLSGTLILPPAARGVVVFAHGSGSSRHSPRNVFVAEVLQRNDIGTLLFDLLTVSEDSDYDNRFNITLLTARLLAATLWLRAHERARLLKVGYFGASTGAAAALRAAAAPGADIAAVVSRGGRPDLAGDDALDRVQAPTLLLVGDRDDVVLGLNEQTLARMRCEKKLSVIPGATHLFEEPGTLEEVARQAAEWFRQYFPRP